MYPIRLSDVLHILIPAMAICLNTLPGLALVLASGLRPWFIRA